MSEEKVWVQGAFFKRKSFPNGGAVTNMWSPNVDELCAWLQANKKPDNSIAINISGSKEPRMDDKGNEKLNASLDTWVPQGGQAPQQPFGGQPQAPGVDPQFAAPPQPVGYQQPQAPQAPQQAVGYQQPQAPQAPQQAPMFDPNTGQRLN